MTYTALSTVSTGDLWTAADHNTYIKDNFTEMANRSHSQVIIPGLAAYNQTDTSEIAPNMGVAGRFVLPDSKDCLVYGNFILPTVGAYDLAISAIVRSAASANIYSRVGYYFGDIGTEDYSATSETGTLAATAVTASILKKVNTRSSITLTNNDYISFFFERDATNAADTINTSLNFMTFTIDITLL